MNEMAVCVLPEPVAIWIRARGAVFLERLFEIVDRFDLGGPLSFRS